MDTLEQEPHKSKVTWQMSTGVVVAATVVICYCITLFQTYFIYIGIILCLGLVLTIAVFVWKHVHKGEVIHIGEYGTIIRSLASTKVYSPRELYTVEEEQRVIQEKPRGLRAIDAAPYYDMDEEEIIKPVVEAKETRQLEAIMTPLETRRIYEDILYPDPEVQQVDTKSMELKEIIQRLYNEGQSLTLIAQRVGLNGRYYTRFEQYLDELGIPRRRRKA